MMDTKRENLFTAPIFMPVAFLLLGLAILEKGLNLVGWHVPVIDVFPRQVLDWAVTLLIFDIALVVRQLFESRL